MANVSSSKVKCICGKPVKEGANFCPNCGIKYYRDDDKHKCPHCGKTILVSDNYCLYCGKPNRPIELNKNDYEEFIVGNGRKQSSTISHSSSKNSRASNNYQKTNLLAIIGELILFLAGIIAFSAICLALIDSTGRGKLPVIGWIFVGITYLIFGGQVQSALTAAVVLGIIGGVCFLIGKAER